jgi:hypothetical protein
MKRKSVKKIAIIEEPIHKEIFRQIKSFAKKPVFVAGKSNFTKNYTNKYVRT